MIRACRKADLNLCDHRRNVNKKLQKLAATAKKFSPGSSTKKIARIVCTSPANVRSGVNAAKAAEQKAKKELDEKIRINQKVTGNRNYAVKDKSKHCNVM